MRKTVLLIIRNDPRTSPRPAEGIRIAAGIASSNKIELQVCLTDAAILLLKEEPEDFLDEDHFSRYLPVLRAESGEPILVARNSPHLKELGTPSLPIREIEIQELAQVAAAANYVATF